MVLVDTSVWVSHLSNGKSALSQELTHGNVLIHPFVIGELALGNLRNRAHLMDLLQNLPLAVTAKDSEVMSFIESHRLYSKGIGWVDAHLLASALLSQCHLWTLDRPLERVARSLGVGFQ